MSTQQPPPIPMPPGWSVRWSADRGVWYASNDAGGVVRFGPEVHLWAPGERAALAAMLRAASARDEQMTPRRSLSEVRLEVFRG